jgi:hypothetical protein
VACYDFCLSKRRQYFLTFPSELNAHRDQHGLRNLYWKHPHWQYMWCYIVETPPLTLCNVFLSRFHCLQSTWLRGRFEVKYREVGIQELYLQPALCSFQFACSLRPRQRRSEESVHVPVRELVWTRPNLQKLGGLVDPIWSSPVDRQDPQAEHSKVIIL